jgi:hypothetical protein
MDCHHREAWFFWTGHGAWIGVWCVFDNGDDDGALLVFRKIECLLVISSPEDIGRPIGV